MAQRTVSKQVSSSTVSVQPLSAPSATLMYMDYTYGKSKKSRRGRPSSMRRFKIKYTNTKGIIKTRNIKATSEEKAMSEISDMSQHHYTIVETLDEPEPARGIKNPCAEIQLPSGFTVELPTIDKVKKEIAELEEKRKLMEKWAPIMDKVDPNMGANKREWLAKYAQYHQDAVVTYDPYSLLPIARQVASQTLSLDLSEFKPEKDGGYDDSLSQEDWDAGNSLYTENSYDGFTQPVSNDSWNG